MASPFVNRMTLLTVSRNRSASGQSVPTVVNGGTIGVSLNTINSLESTIGGQTTREGEVLQATCRRSPTSEAVVDNSFARIEGDLYKVSGVSKGGFNRRELIFTLERVSEVQ